MAVKLPIKCETLPRKAVVDDSGRVRKPPAVPPEAIRVDPPQYRGSFVGHTVYVKVRRKVGTRMVTIDPPRPVAPRKDGTARRHKDGSPIMADTMRYPVMATEYDAVWTWDGRRWIRDYRENAGVGDGPVSNGTHQCEATYPGVVPLPGIGSAVRGEVLSNKPVVGRQHPDRDRRLRRDRKRRQEGK